MNIFKALVNASDLEWEFVAVSIVKAHQHSTSAASDQDQAIGKSVAGNTKKIHIAVEEFCLPIKFQITDGEVHDYKIAPELIATLPTEDFIISEEHDSEEVREIIRRKSSIPLIPRKSNSILGNADNAFARLKHFRAIATRYDKLKRNYAAMACAYLCLPM